MADRKLNSIKFPDLADRYILDADNVNYSDSDTYKSGSVGEALQKSARIDGTYDELTAGSAEQLLSSAFVEDTEPYKYRTTGGSADVGDREYVDAIVGGSVAWNQLCNGASVTVPNSHKYFMSKDGTTAIGASSGSAITGLTSGTDMVIDLTQLFGTTIADHIYSLEQSNAGAGVAFFEALFPNDYYVYDSGSIKSVEGVSEHTTVGFNQWDEVWERGAYDVDDGSPYDANQIRSKNYIPVLPDTNYYIKANPYVWMMFFDENKNILTADLPNTGASAGNARGVGDQIFKTPIGCAFIKFYCQTLYGNTYNNDICINLSWSGWRNGEYEPYQKHSYALDSSLTLRGVPKLANGKLYFDGDEYKYDGSVTRKYGVVDLGSLTWSYSSESGHERFEATLPTPMTPVGAVSYVPNLICTKYGASSFAGLYGHYADKIIGGWSANMTTPTEVVIVYDSAYTSASTFKTAMDGVYLVYELATPTTEETADPYQQIQICDDFGTEEYTSTSIVPIGHETRYPSNLRDKLQHLPNLAENDGYYMISQTNKQMSLELFRIPKAPSTNGTYVLKATVSGGTPTYTWVEEN